MFHVRLVTRRVLSASVAGIALVLDANSRARPCRQ